MDYRAHQQMLDYSEAGEQHEAALRRAGMAAPDRAFLPIDEDFPEPHLEPPFFDLSPLKCAAAAVAIVMSAAFSAIYPWGIAP